MSNKKKSIVIALTIGLAGMTGVVLFQEFEIPWYTVDGGGYTGSTGGEFRLSGTIGQPDAGTVMSGGDFALFTVAGGFFPGGGGPGETRVRWINAEGGTWSTGGNWSTGAPPGPGEKALITLEGDYTVTLDVDATVAGLTLGDASGTQTLEMVSRTLTLNGSSSIESNGVVSMQSSTITVSNVDDTLTNRGLLLCGATCNLRGAGNLSNEPGALIRIGVSSSGSTRLTVANGFTNDGTIELTQTVAGWAATLNVTNGTLVNTGTIDVLVGARGGARGLGAEIDNQGTINVEQYLTIAKAHAGHTSSGTINITGGGMTVTLSGTAPSFNTNGTIDASGGDLAFNLGGDNGSATNTGTITIGNGQTCTIWWGTFNQKAGSIGGVRGKLAFNSTTANFTTPFSNAEMTLSMFMSTFNGPGTLTNAPGASLSMDASTINAPFDHYGTVVCQRACAINGSFNGNPGGSLIRVEGARYGNASTLTVANGFINEGQIELTSIGGTTALLNVSAGTLVNAPGGTINALVGVGGGRTLGAQLDNRGKINVEQPLTITKADAQHTNSGAINIAGGDLTVSLAGTDPSLSTSGTIDIAFERTLTVSGGTFIQTAGETILNDAKLVRTGTPFDVQGGLLSGFGTVSGDVTNPGGQVAPGLSPGILIIDRDYTQGANGALTVEIGGREPGDEYDVLAIIDSAALDGTLNIELIDGFVPDLEDTFEVLIYASQSGNFAVYNGLNIGGGKRFEPKLGPTSLVLEVVSGGCAGREKLKRPKCKEKRGVNKMTVKLVNGLEGDIFRVELSSGETKQGTVNGSGKGKAKFKRLPTGPGTATATWGCGAKKKKNYTCP